MDNQIVKINKAEYGCDYDLWQDDEIFRSAFFSYDDYFKFWNELSDAHPDGLPWEYIVQKLEQQRYYRMLETLASLEEKKLVIKSQNEDGEDVWILNHELS
jgi:hypothetical protein